MLDTNKVDIVSCKPTTSVYEAKHFRNSHLPFGDEDKHTKTLESVLFPHDLTSSCFELTDMHRQTSWITVYDGRGVFAENVNLLILVRDKNIVWVDVEVECSRWGGFLHRSFKNSSIRFRAASNTLQQNIIPSRTIRQRPASLPTAHCPEIALSASD